MDQYCINNYFFEIPASNLKLQSHPSNIVLVDQNIDNNNTSKTFILNVMKAVKLTPNDNSQYIVLDTNSQIFLSEMSDEINYKIIAFGISPALLGIHVSAIKNKVININKISLIIADHPDTYQNMLNKKTLWDSLQKVFIG